MDTLLRQSIDQTGVEQHRPLGKTIGQYGNQNVDVPNILQR